MTEQYRSENNALYNAFLEDYFYKAFRKGERSIELIFSPKCNEACTYCYLTRTYPKLYPDCDFDNADILGNVQRVLRWMKHNKFTCSLDIFSGELFAQQIGFDLIDLVYEEYKDANDDEKIRDIIIPTNFSFLASETLENKVRSQIEKLNSIGIPLLLSASMDGKYMDANRPFRGNIDIPINFVRDDAYYDKVFSFAKEYDFGFHPMIWRKNLDKWIQNFDWFQENYEKHGISWKNLYLLHVRNDGWTAEENKMLYDFLQHVIDFAAKKCNYDPKTMFDFVTKDRGFNIMNMPFVNLDRGIGCSMQTSLAIRMSDMKHFPCHRLMYPDFEIGHFDADMNFHTEHAELGLTIFGFHVNSQPMCSKCPVNKLCIGGCIGSQFEANGEMFAPIKSVCRTNFTIIKAVVDGLDRYGVLDNVKSVLGTVAKNQVEWIKGAKI